MLSERVIRRALGILNSRYLATEPVDVERLPEPEAGKRYTLYAHVPFCERLCTYCSFNRFLYKEDRARAYFCDLRAEMRMASELGYDFDSLYIGGGTPTILLDELCETIDLAHELFPSLGEVSSETSPNHLNDELVSLLAGRVHRLSVGIQSFDDRLLRQMDRYGKYGSGDEVFERVSSVASLFPSFNVDMIFNFPSQTEDVLLRDIELVKATGANQTTFYPLMASPLRRKELAETVGDLDYEREAHYYRLVCEGLKPEFNAASAWTFSRDPSLMIDEYIVDYPEYVGIGSGALSYLRDTVIGNTFSLAEYHERISSGRMGVVKHGKPYGFFGRMRYRFVTDLFGLRLDKRKFRRDFGVPVEIGLAAELAFLGAVGGIRRITAEEITLTDKGRYLLLVMMRETLALSNDARDRARAELPLEERILLLEGDTSALLDATPELAAI
ncbi:MAG TPA: coproporphyrinogen III oxidase family protein [Coriobacteriia bacterium]|nr:coproporphyrinogen III oxidase family protein [Coriobacteriia bacterium]